MQSTNRFKMTLVKFATKPKHIFKPVVFMEAWEHYKHTQILFCQNSIKVFLRPLTQTPCVQNIIKVQITICKVHMMLIWSSTVFLYLPWPH
jgi:hypothetical protein